MRFSTHRGTLVALLVLLASPALAEYRVNERGECVEEWTAASLGRGPVAVLNAPLVPFRSMVGGVMEARDDKSPGTRSKILLPPMLAFAGGAMGLVESMIWAGTGVADTATGGYFALAPEEATELSVSPMTPALMGNRSQPATDPCGRRVTAR
jgi:hypothetical protein